MADVRVHEEVKFCKIGRDLVPCIGPIDLEDPESTAHTRDHTFHICEEITCDQSSKYTVIFKCIKENFYFINIQ